MAQPFSTRDDLKRDILQDTLKLGFDWVAANRQTFFSVLGTVGVAGVVAVFVFTNFQNLKRQAWERYNLGQTRAATNNPQNAISTFDEVVSKFGRTPAAAYALLGKGDVLYQQRRYPDAIAAYRQCLEKSPSKIIAPFVLAGLGAALEDSGDYTGAIETYKQFTSNYPDHILAPKMYESLARTYELSKNLDAAKEVYEKIITMFPETFWSEKARGRYQALAPQPFQNVPAPASQGAPSKP